MSMATRPASVASMPFVVVVLLREASDITVVRVRTTTPSSRTVIINSMSEKPRAFPAATFRGRSYMVSASRRWWR